MKIDSGVYSFMVFDKGFEFLVFLINTCGKMVLCAFSKSFQKQEVKSRQLEKLACFGLCDGCLKGNPDHMLIHVARAWRQQVVDDELPSIT